MRVNRAMIDATTTREASEGSIAAVRAGVLSPHNIWPLHSNSHIYHRRQAGKAAVETGERIEMQVICW